MDRVVSICLSKRGRMAGLQELVDFIIRVVVSTFKGRHRHSIVYIVISIAIA